MIPLSLLLKTLADLMLIKSGIIGKYSFFFLSLTPNSSLCLMLFLIKCCLGSKKFGAGDVRSL